MRSIFDETTRAEVITRINSLSLKSQALWGKMNVEQMVRHCVLAEEYYQGNIKINRSFLGRLLGKTAIRSILKNDDTQLGKNAPTSDQFRISYHSLDLEKEKLKWKSLVEKYASFKDENFTHWFFGPMTKEQLGQFIYKHCDHHLRQFGA